MKKLKYIDKSMIIVILLFCIGGILAVYSASVYSAATRYDQTREYFFIRQVLFVVIGLFLYFITMIFDYRQHQRFAIIYHVITVGMLVVVFFTGQTTGGASRWIDIGPLRLQPVELAKISLVIFIANDFVNRQKDKKRPFYYVLGALLATAFLSIIQPDNGSAIIMIFVFFIMFVTTYFSEKRARIALLTSMVSLIAVLGLLFAFFSYTEIGNHNSHILTRFISWVNPFADYEGQGYQLSNSYIAISNGRFFGVGIGNGSQKLGYLPDSHTDFIIANIAEETGLFGVLMIMFGYVFLIWKSLRIAIETSDLFGKMLALGLTTLFFMQAMWNMAGVSGLLPLKGLTAPFLSYGGSSLFMMFILFGILQNIHIQNRLKKERKTVSRESEVNN